MATENAEITGYGIFGSLADIDEAIKKRAKIGLPLTGEGEVLFGATIVNHEDGSVSLEDPNRPYYRLAVRVGPTGKYVANLDLDSFAGESPILGWREVENP